MPGNAQLIQRADMTLADLSSSGLLNPEQANTFIDEIQLQPTIIKQSRLVRMKAPQLKINRLGFGSRILQAAPQGTSPHAADDGTNDRHLAAAKRSKPSTGAITLISKELMAEVHLPYELFEDNIEGDKLEGHIMRLIAAKTAEDLEDWALLGDTASGDDFYALNDGLLKTATSHVVDHAAAGINPDMFEDGLLALPKKYHRNLNNLINYVPVFDNVRYRANVAKRTTGYGDSALTESGQLVAYGVPVEPAPLMPDNFGLLTFPNNIIFGIQRDITVEYDKDIRARQFIVVVTIRCDVKWDLEDAVVKYININA
jgi:hypothetical protein